VSAGRRTRPPGERTLEALRAAGFAEAELFTKRSRSRSATWEPDRQSSAGAEEAGWAVRASAGDGAIHLAGTGEPPRAGPWPSPAPPAVAFPEPGPSAPPWSEPEDLDAPLLGEGEAMALLRALAARLAAEHPEARLLRAALEDGVAEVEILNSHGIAAAHRTRLATLHLWAALGGIESQIYVASREPRRFVVGSLARRLADQLVVLSGGAAPEAASRAPAVLGGEVMAELLDAVSGLWTDPARRHAFLQWAAPGERLGSERVSLVDDGRLAGGLLCAPVDGEGVPTARVVLVEAGVSRAALRSWRTAGSAAGEDGDPVGCLRRPGWRDQPLPGPSHLYLEPDRGTAPSALLAGLERGFYFLGVDGAVRVDWGDGSLEAPVYGFAIERGRPAQPIRGARLRTGIPKLFGSIGGVGRDLRFLPRRGGCVGAPTVRVDEISVEPA
jgi:PmbA protein